MASFMLPSLIGGSMEPVSQPEKPVKKPRDAHSNFRKGISDYNDGTLLTHHLGNDDYDGQNQPDLNRENPEKLDGKVAYGNEDILDEDET